MAHGYACPIVKIGSTTVSGVTGFSARPNIELIKETNTCDGPIIIGEKNEEHSIEISFCDLTGMASPPDTATIELKFGKFTSTATPTISYTNCRRSSGSIPTVNVSGTNPAEFSVTYETTGDSLLTVALS